MKKKKTIINIIYYAILLGIFYFFMRYAFSLFLPFIVALIIAAILQRPLNALCRKTHIKKGVLAAIMVLLLVAVIAALAVLAGAELVNAGKSFASFVSAKISSFPTWIGNVQTWLYEKIKVFPDSVEKFIRDAVDGVVLKLTSSGAAKETVKSVASGIDLSVLSGPLSGIWSFAKGIPSTLIAVVVSIIASCFITADYDSLINFIRRQVPESKRNNLSMTKSIIKNSLFKFCKAYALIILITFCEIALGLKILDWVGAYKGGYIIFIAAVTAIVDILPVLGTGTIFIPWAIYSMITGNVKLGIGLLIVYVCITVIRQFIEPKLVAGQLGLPPFITIMGMFIGLKLFGVIGMLIIPLVIILIKLLNDAGVIHLWVPEEEPDGEDASQNKENTMQKIISKMKSKKKE